VSLRGALVAAILTGLLAPGRQASVQPSKTLTPTIPIHATLAGGERTTYTFDVPAGMAAHVAVEQDGVDVALVLRSRGATTPLQSMDFVGGRAGTERACPLVSDAAAAWDVVVVSAQPRATRGGYTITLDLAPADAIARAVAAARDLHYRTLAPNAVEDGATIRREQAGYQAAANAALAAGDIEQAAESTFQAARRADTLGDTLGAIDGQKQALELFRRAERPDREGRSLNRLGDLSRKIGEVVDAEQYFNEALPLSRAAGDSESVADILNNSGLLLLVVGRYDEAVERLQAAIPMAQEIDSANVEGAANNNIGEAYYGMGDYVRAAEYYQRASNVLSRLNLPRRVGRAQQGLAESYYAQGDRAKADETIKRAIALLEQAGDRSYLAEGLSSYGLMRHGEGDNDAAIALFARAQPMLRDSHNSRVESRVLTGWSEADLERGDLDEALAKADEALQLARDVSSPAGQARALYVRARVMQARGRLGEAADAVDAALHLVEDTRGAIRRSELRTSYLAAVSGYYDLAVDLLEREGRIAEAFAMSERSRARTLLEGLAQSAAQIDKGVDAAAIARRRALQSRIDAKENYRAQLALSGGKTAQVTATARDIASLREQLAGVERQIQSASPDYWALQKPQPVAADHVQSGLLDADTTLVEYHVGADRSYAFVVDRGSIASVTLPGEHTVDDLARRYHETLSRDLDPMTAADRVRTTAQATALGQQLAAAVWAPVAPRVKGSRLLVVADGALQYVPFAALPDRSGRPLLATHEIVYLPSASVLDSLRRDSRPVAGAATAVFADPVFSKSDPRLAAARDAATASPARGPAPSAGSGASRAPSRDAGGEYGRLRFSRREAEAIAAVAPGAFQALDFSAAKSTLLGRSLRNYRILHFATHGSLDTQHPEQSGLVFSLVDKNGKPVDGFLRLHEIYNLDLDADLVVLSACRTALGKEVHGEGLIGLTRGFMYAGASRVVSSIWNVDDRASAELMKRFYTAMLAGKKTPAAALRDAQLSLLKDPRWASPHYWAAFSAFGEPN
jgi:CHAT domain-containing protein/Tfp pilus assembly protein PilF